MKIKIPVAILSTICISMTAHALKVEKPINVAIPISTKALILTAIEQPKKEVTLLSYTLTQEERDVLTNRSIESDPKIKNYSLPHKIDLGMNGVPVLDQGKHGTCVTFAVTAAIDAALGKGDYISQLCNLELGSYLEKHSYLFSGWEGSFGSLVLSQMMFFGIVNKEKQAASVCANVAEYPLLDKDNIGNPMSLSNFKKHSENISEKVYWHHVFGGDDFWEAQSKDRSLTGKVLEKVKESLSKGHRLTIGAFLIIPRNCMAGACASHKSAFDTWALTKEMDEIPYRVGGHKMVIIGYDDDAVAYDRDGYSHKGLLKLRNSWGNEVGDKGDFYVSYDFFKKFVKSVEAIIPRQQ